MAVPGSIFNPLARGCHHLIQQGAYLIQSVEDILEAIRFTNERISIQNSVPEQKNLDIQLQNLVECVGYEPTSVEKLIKRKVIPMENLLALLFELELNGYIKAVPGGYVRL